MSRTVALRIVSEEFYRKELDFSIEHDGRAHSLHYAVALPRRFMIGGAAYCIRQYSAPGDVVLDPFCGGGERLLEAALMGRIPRGSDLNPLGLRIAHAKLHPVDITQVTLKLQEINLRAPINSQLFSSYFSPFYDINTFREIFNLRKYLHSHTDRASRFLEMVVLGLLHGPGAGCLSVYSFPQISISPAEQLTLNAKRCQVPDYRAVAPRILRRAAMLTRDGLPSLLLRSGQNAHLAKRDARDLNYVGSASIDLIVTRVPVPSGRSQVEGLWLKLWFAGITAESFSQALASRLSLASWLDFMNESLLEMARVVKHGKRAVLEFEDVKLPGEERLMDEVLIEMIKRDLGRYWNVEGVLINREKSAVLKHALQSRRNEGGFGRNRMVVLKRR